MEHSALTEEHARQLFEGIMACKPAVAAADVEHHTSSEKREIAPIVDLVRYGAEDQQRLYGQRYEQGQRVRRKFRKKDFDHGFDTVDAVVLVRDDGQVEQVVHAVFYITKRS